MDNLPATKVGREEPGEKEAFTFNPLEEQLIQIQRLEACRRNGSS
jgi:hypothetical protein